MGLLTYLKSIPKILKEKDKLQCGKYTVITSDCWFEGNNLVSNHSYLRNTEIGYATYVGSNTVLSSVKIGRYCSIGSYVSIIVGNHPTSQFVSTHPLFYSTQPPVGKSWVDRDKYLEKSKVRNSDFYCCIGNDVWIGDHVKLINGITIGDGCIIAAGAVVTKDVPPYSIVGGVPAKLIRKRFPEETIQKLLKLSWWNKEPSWIKSRAESFDSVETFIEMNLPE